MKLHSLVTIIVVATFLFSCGGKPQDSKQLPDATTLETTITHLVSKDFPRPSEIPYLVMSTGADYNQTLINSRQNVDAYLAQPDKAALNLGVYAADMGYLASYEKTQESIEYFGSCRRIADELGIIQGFDPEMVKKVDSSIGNRDSLTAALDEAVDNATVYMNQGHNSKLGALIITGSFVESLFLATGIVKTYPKNAFADPNQGMNVLSGLISVVMKQHKAVAEVSSMLTKVDQSETVTQLIKDFADLQAAYDQLAPLRDQISKGDANLTFNDQTLAGVTKTIEKLRADIVK